MEPDEVPNELVSDAYLDKMERVVLNADSADPPTLQNTPDRRRVHDNFTLAAISEIRSLREWIESVERALAASQASERALREALDHLLREWMAWQPGLTGVARTRAEAILAHAPGDYAALRAFGERLFAATLEATRSHCACDAENSWSRDEIISRVMGDTQRQGATTKEGGE